MRAKLILKFKNDEKSKPYTFIDNTTYYNIQCKSPGKHLLIPRSQKQQGIVFGRASINKWR